MPEPDGDLYQPPDIGSSKLECREFKGRIQRDWVISSFSYFAAGIHEELPDRDNVSPAREEQIPGEGIFAFPRGAETGVCLHEILEELDFTSGDEHIIQLVNQRLQAHDLAQTGHAEAVSQMLQNLLRFPLATGCPGFNLARIPLAEQLRELEFYFPVEGVSAAQLNDLLGKSGWSSVVPVQLGRLAFDPIKGFLKGFIDLVFRFEDRYYVVDWKSNWLGDCVEDYSLAAIKEEMRRQHYFIQYHLYTVATHKYLSLRAPGYDYEKHFGGVLYLFLRGLDPARPEYGAYRDRPALSVVNQLSTLLEGK